MASTYSDRLRIELIGTGEQSGTWGDTTNTNLGTLIDEAIAGVASITMTDADYTLTVANGATDEARQAVLVLTGTLSTTRNVICPNDEKVYIVKNATTGGQSIVIKTSAGTGITVPNGFTYIVYCDATNVLSAGSYQPLDADLTAIAGLAGTSGFLKKTNTDTWTLDTNTYLTTSDAASTYLTQANAATTYQPLDGDLTAIAGISSNGILKRTGVDTWAVVTAPTGDVVGTSDSQTLTNKTINGSNNTITNVNLSTGVTGTLPLTSGGTGLTAISARSIFVANTANTLTTLTPAAGQSLRVNASNTAWEAYTPSTSTGTVSSVSGTGTVSGLTLTGTVTTTGSLTLGGTLSVLPSNFASQTANTFLSAPNGTAGTPTFRAIVAADIPTLNQNTTGTASNITGVAAIANGGTGQTSKAAAYNALSPITSTGDLIIGNGANSATRLAIGTNGQVLQSNGTTAVWATASGGDLVRLGTQSLSGTSPSAVFTGLSGTSFLIAVNAVNDGSISGSESLSIQFYNGSSVLVTSGYRYNTFTNSGSNVVLSSVSGVSSIAINNLANTPSVGLFFASYNAAIATAAIIGVGDANYPYPIRGSSNSVATALTGFALTFSNYSSVSGSVSVYRLNV